MRILRYIVFLFSILCVCVGCIERRAKVVEKSFIEPKGQIISFSEELVTDTLSFGRVSAGERVEKSFYIRNDFSTLLVITKVMTSCNCLVFDYQLEPIKAGESSQIKINFNSAGYNFWFTKSVYIYTSATPKPLKIVVTADMK